MSADGMDSPETSPLDGEQHPECRASPGSYPLSGNTQFANALEDADLLLYYAASRGQLPTNNIDNQLQHDSTIVHDIVKTREAAKQSLLSLDLIVSFWKSYSSLSLLTKPVTADSIRASNSKSLTKTKLGAAFLVSIIIAFSTFLFASNSTANDTIDLIDQQNAGALKLWSDLQILRATDLSKQGNAVAKDSVDISDQRAAAFAERAFEELAEFSRRSNWLLESASRLHNWFNPPWISIDVTDLDFKKGNPIGVEHLRVPPDIRGPSSIADEIVNQIQAYQRIRDYAIAVYKTNTIIYGGISTYLLPTIYALLGAYLYGFRFDSRLIRQKEYLRTGANNTRYFIAAIAGLVIGLFGSLLPKNVSLPALAVAFLVGYAVEAFFSRLDSLAISLEGDQAPQPRGAHGDAA